MLIKKYQNPTDPIKKLHQAATQGKPTSTRRRRKEYNTSEKASFTNIKQNVETKIIEKNKKDQKDKEAVRKALNYQKNKQTSTDIQKMSEQVAARTALEAAGIDVSQLTNSGEIRNQNDITRANTQADIMNSSLWFAPNGYSSYAFNPNDPESTQQAFSTGAVNTAGAISTAMGAPAGIGNLFRGIAGGIAGAELLPMVWNNKYASMVGGLAGGVIAGSAVPLWQARQARINPYYALNQEMNHSAAVTPLTNPEVFKTENPLPIKIKVTNAIMPERAAWNTGKGRFNNGKIIEVENRPEIGQFTIADNVENPHMKAVHFKTDRNTMTNAEKMAMFEALAEQVPEGDFVSTYGSLSPGGVHGLQRFGTDFGFNLVGERDATLKGTGEPIKIPVWQKPITINKQRYPYLEFDGKNMREVPVSELYQRALKKMPQDLIYETSEPNFVYDAPNGDKYNFITMNEMDPGPFNKEFAQETARRLENLGYNVDELMSIPTADGYTVLQRPRKAITDRTSQRVILGYDPDNGDYGGLHVGSTGKTYMELTNRLSKASTVFHENNMHTTDAIIARLENIEPSKPTKSMYTDVLNELFYNVNLSKLPNVDAASWKEFRATIGEAIRKLHYKLRGEGSIVQNVPKFEKLVDSMSNEEVAKLLEDMNGYGQIYAAVLRTRPQLIPKIKHLLKYAPEVAFGAYGLDQLNSEN